MYKLEQQTSVRRAAVIAGLIGFFVPVACGILEMVMFNGRDRGMTHFVAYVLPNVICPAWLLGTGSAFWIVAIPLLNAGMYAGLTAAFLQYRTAVRNR